MSTGFQEIDFSKVKVKQEKPSPPRKKDPCDLIDEIIPKLFDASPTNADASSTDDNSDDKDEKKAVEPIKSSNEILAELFRVFNAAPPETLLNDDYLIEKNKREHKAKKKKKSSKSKKRSKAGSGAEQDSNQQEDKKSHKKHKKKKHKRNKNDEKSPAELEIKKEKLDDRRSKESDKKSAKQHEEPKASDISDFTISSEDETYSKSVRETPRIVVKKENERKSDSSKHQSSSRKIVIKSLSDSKVFKAAERVQKRKNQESCEKNGHDSDITLSDEETYLREREERYRSRRDNHHGDRRSRDSRDRDRERCGSSWRDRNILPTSRDDRWRRNHSGSRSRSHSRYNRSNRSRSRSWRRDDLMIDKKRLLEIARKNAITMFKDGSLPGTQSMSQEVRDKVLLKMRYGGKTVEDLTEFCKKLSNGENLNELSSLSSNDDSDHDKHGNDKAFHHPFVLKDRGPIVMNIKNATPIAPKTAEQAKAILLQYPVSSGQQHRLNESEWVPVPTPKPVPAPRPEPSTAVVALKTTVPKNVFQKPLPAETQQPAFVPTNPSTTTTNEADDKPPEIETVEAITSTTVAEIPASSAVADAESAESIFPSLDKNVDVSSIITKRLNAMRKLQENPMDPEALKMMYNSQKDMSAWATSKTTPGLFTGSTGANILSARELTAGQQAWAKRDQLILSAPVSGGMGMHLLQKMGWKPGEGLGKTKNGSLQPLLLEVKIDKRGLVTREEDPSAAQARIRRKRPPVNSSAQIQASIESKHPVSLLGELSAKRKWGAPFFEMVNENGPAHHRNFVYKVIVNGMMYQPSIACNTKKEAKALAAKYCLQQMGILPT